MTLQETRAYDDIINLPHHQSRKHPHMSRHQRAAQFMPFAALTGYNQVIEQTAKNAETAIAQAEAQGQAQRLEIQTEARTHARAGARRTGRLSEGEGRVPGKTPGPAGVQVTRRERSAVVRLLAGRGHRLDHLLRIAGLPKSTYYHHLSRPAHVSRPDVEPMVREIWDGSTSTNGGGTSSNASASASP